MIPHYVTRINVLSFIRKLHAIHTYFPVKRHNVCCHIYRSVRNFFRQLKWCSK
jgi:hypothetical protein